jgi:hypothetical protein
MQTAMIDSLRTYLNCFKWMSVVIVAACATHLVWTTAVLLSIESSYQHRLFNLRKIEANNIHIPYTGFVTSLIQHAGNRPIVFIGSSFTFGYDYSEGLIFTRKVAASLPEKTVVNASMLAWNIFGMFETTLCALTQANNRAAIIITELPVINDAESARTWTRGSLLRPPCISRSPWAHLAKLPQGTNWIATARDEMVGRDDRSVILQPLPPDWIIPASIYSRSEPELRRRYIDYLDRLRPHAGRVIAFVSPLYVDGLERLGFDRANMQRQLLVPLEACRAVPGIECLDTSSFTHDGSMYINVSHLGIRGHEAFAQWLLPHLRQSR